jgi:hypothetical protein
MKSHGKVLDVIDAIGSTGSASRMRKERISTLGRIVYDSVNVTSRDREWIS